MSYGVLSEGWHLPVECRNFSRDNRCKKPMNMRKDTTVRVLASIVIDARLGKKESYKEFFRLLLFLGVDKIFCSN
jgi:hypothetical protein